MCDHCCFACSPRVTKRIPEARLRTLIDEACDVPSLKRIGFTGGECFLLGDELDHLIGLASGHGFNVMCVTNGYWAVNRKAAVKRMRSLAACGLESITFSTGQMHSTYVPVERIVHGAVAAADLGMTVKIAIEDFLGTSFDWRSVTEHPEIAARRGACLDIFSRSWIPNAEGKGRTELRHRRSGSRFRKGAAGGCDSVLGTISVTPELVLIACSGYPMESIPELHLGSVAERTIADVLKDTPDDFLKVLIHVKGPEFMLEFVKRFVPDYKLPKANVHPCQTCLHMHRDPIAMSVLREHAHELKPEVLAMSGNAG